MLAMTALLVSCLNAYVSVEGSSAVMTSGESPSLTSTSPPPSQAVLIVNQPKCGTGFLTNTLVNALSCHSDKPHPLLPVEHVSVHSCGSEGNRSMVIRSHSPVHSAAVLKVYFPKVKSTTGTCHVVTATRDPRIAVASQFFQQAAQKDLCSGEQPVAEVLARYRACKVVSAIHMEKKSLKGIPPSLLSLTRTSFFFLCSPDRPEQPQQHSKTLSDHG